MQYYKHQKDALSHYKKAASYGFNDIQFTLEYSDLLKMLDYTGTNLQYLQRTSLFILAPDIEFRLGNAFLSVEEYDSAITRYENIHYMSPSKFRPLYYLAKVYYEQENFTKADSIADIIIKKEPKVYSAEVIRMKEEMKMILRR